MARAPGAGGGLARGDLPGQPVVKLTALTPLLRPEEPSPGQADARRRLVSLLRLARDLGAHLHVDVETFGTRDAVSETVLGVLGEPEFAEGPSVGIVLQGYLVDSDSRLAVAPIVVGGGKQSLPNNVRVVLELLDERRFGNGAVHLHYRTRT